LWRIIGALLSILKPDHVVGAAAVIAKLLRSGDNIIRGSDYRGKVAAPLEIITKTVKRLDISHASLNITSWPAKVNEVSSSRK
jgi:hypothetical protein